MSPFLKLDDFLAPLPLPALIALLIVCGFSYLGIRLIRWLSIETPIPIHLAAGFMLAAALIAAAVHLLAFLGLAYIWLLRPLAWLLVALGILALSRLKWEWLLNTYGQFRTIFLGQSFWGRAALGLMVITGIVLLLAALGPPTDADSLHYHLGVPLDILRHHEAYPRSDWIFARLTGLGESLNMLGLAGGTDIVGAVLQFAGLLAALTAVISMAKTDEDRILLAVLVLGCPLVASMITSQKPQMLPSAATTVAIVLIAQRFKAMDPGTLLLAFGCTFFAMACKYTYIPTGSIVAGLGMIAAYRARRLPLAMGMALACYLVLVFPGQWQNFRFYGDPVSPFLERFRQVGDPVVMRFAGFYEHFPIFQNGLPFPLNMIVPNSREMLPYVIGMGPLLVLVGLKEIKETSSKVLLIGSLLAAPFALYVTRDGARFLFELYLWVIPLAAATPWRRTKTLLFKIMVGQLLVVSLLINGRASFLFRGALTASLRDKVMAGRADGYLESRWLDKVLPGDAKVLFLNYRFYALLPRPFLRMDFVEDANLDDAGERQRIRRLLESNRVNTLIAPYPLDDETAKTFGPLLAKRQAGPEEVASGFIQNPGNPKDTIRLLAYRLNIKRSHDLPETGN